jgi:hypothetical protein
MHGGQQQQVALFLPTATIVTAPITSATATIVTAIS